MDEGRAARRVQVTAVGVAGFLVLLKAAGAAATGSLALGSAALDSLIDVFVSAANYLVLRRAAAPPDADHAYGHGKFENLAALAQGLFLVGAAAALVWAGVDRFGSEEVPRESGLGMGVLAVAMLASVAVSRMLARTAERTGSPALKADSLHYRTDLWTNGAALLALVLVRWTGWWQADPLVALGVAAMVLRSAGQLIADAAADLSDRGLPPDELTRIQAVVATFHPRVSGVHDLRTRKSGGQRFVEFHLEIPSDTTFVEAHALMVEVLRAVERELPRTKVFVHGDPV